MENKRLLIIDGLNMFLRNYVINPTLAPTGHPIGGCIGFLKSLQKVSGMFTPDEIIIAWDGHSGSAKRKEMNKDYKAGRKPVRFNRRMVELNEDEQIINKAEQYVKLVEYLNETPTIQIVVDYVEADDIIAYACGHDNLVSWLNMVFIPIILPLLEPLQEISQITYQAYLGLGLKQLKIVFLLWVTKRYKLLSRLQNIAETWTNRLNFTQTYLLGWIL